MDAEPEVTSAPEAPSPNAEAARYRTQLRAAEKTAQGLQERVSRLQRAEASRLASEILADPDDLFDVGRVDMASLLDDDGELDSAKVANAVASLAEAKPQLTKGYQGEGGGLFSAQGSRLGGYPSGTATFAALFSRAG